MLLHSLKRDKGVKLLDYPYPMLKPILLGNIVAHNLVTNDRRRAALETHVSDYFWHRRMVIGFSLKTVMAEVSQPSLKRSYILTGGKVLLNGAAGDRARNFIREAMNFSEESIEHFKSHFADLADLETINVGDQSSSECWIETKNFYNFFHFITESFHKAFSPCINSRNVKTIRFVSKSERVEEFVTKWANACSELLDSNILVSAGRDVELTPPESILVPLSAKHLLYQIAGEHQDQINAARPAGHSWTGYDAAPHSVKILGMNSYDDSLEACREKIISISKRTIERRWSKKIYVTRSKNIARKRVMKGEIELINTLSKRGFEVVCFEEMSPLEQVKCVSEARCIVMQHGAGMTNMLFASSNAHVFELGTYQTAMARWSDFIPICHVAGCHYHHIFLNMDFDKEDKDPVFAEDGLVPPIISKEDVKKITSLIMREVRDRKNGTLSGLIAHAKFFIQRNAYLQAYRLLDQCLPYAGSYGEYWEQRAKLDELCGHRNSACNNYVKAWEISRSEVAKKEFLRLADDHDRRRDILLNANNSQRRLA